MKLKKFIPLDKSWIIRMGFLDAINGYSDINIFLNKQKILSDDLLALKNAVDLWQGKKPINIGESGTVYRLFQFASWKLKLNKKFIKKGTLKSRKITSNQNMINFSLNELLKLDNGTSQWASAAVLMGNGKKPSDIPYKLKLTYKALRHWKSQRKKNKVWIAQYDDTIYRQANAFLRLCRGQKVTFRPRQAEDYCFARAFGYVDKKIGYEKWPNLVGHESNRIEEMEKVLSGAKNDLIVDSRDHRVVQAIVMWGIVNNRRVKIKYPEAVNKSWPEFWNFINHI